MSDGFPMAFVQAYWSVLKGDIFLIGVLKEDIIAVFRSFHVEVTFEKSLNVTFLALIPKKVDVVDVKDF